jgi:hypothetical protein
MPNSATNLMNRLIKTFIIATILGAIGTGVLLWYVPAVDLHRERSLISVRPNGGNVEMFHINLPRDRVMAGQPNPGASIPAALEWPGQEIVGDMQTEIFKIRDREETVIGVGSRITSLAEATGPFIEWILHFPARGSLYVRMENMPVADGFRNGLMLSGTGDFSRLSGTVDEAFVADADDIQSRIMLQTTLVGAAGELE